jgi:hypothetical protein
LKGIASKQAAKSCFPNATLSGSWFFNGLVCDLHIYAYRIASSTTTPAGSIPKFRPVEINFEIRL